MLPWGKIKDAGVYDNKSNLTKKQRSEGGIASAALKTREELQKTGIQNRDNNAGFFSLDDDGESKHLLYSAEGGAGNKGKSKKGE
jgi:hypothetical protein